MFDRWDGLLLTILSFVALAILLLNKIGDNFSSLVSDAVEKNMNYVVIIFLLLNLMIKLT